MKSECRFTRRYCPLNSGTTLLHKLRDRNGKFYFSVFYFYGHSCPHKVNEKINWKLDFHWIIWWECADWCVAVGWNVIEWMWKWEQSKHKKGFTNGCCGFVLCIHLTNNRKFHFAPLMCLWIFLGIYEIICLLKFAAISKKFKITQKISTHKKIEFSL